MEYELIYRIFIVIPELLPAIRRLQAFALNCNFPTLSYFPYISFIILERKAFGRFYYRFPNGEAGFDVYSRVTSFISTVLRDAAHLRAEVLVVRATACILPPECLVGL